MAGDERDVVALVLAGGAARRFGSDKTRADLNGRTVLARTVTQVAEVVERVVWEVVPVLAETIIKEEISRLTR